MVLAPKPLHPLSAAEMTRVQLSGEIDAPTRNAIGAPWILFVRDRGLDDEKDMRLATIIDTSARTGLVN